MFLNQANTAQLGQLMLDSMAKMINNEGEFAILSSTPTASNQNAWIASMKDRLAKDPAFAKMKLVQVAYGQESEQINQQQTLAWRRPSRTSRASSCRPASVCPPRPARSNRPGMTGKIKLSGLAPASLLRKYIKAGDVQDVWWNVKDLGYLTYYAAQAVAQCKMTGKAGETFKAGRLGEYTVGENGEVLLGPPVVVTPDNVDSFKF